MKIIVDTDNCIGSGSCVLEAADVFAQDEKGLVVLLLKDIPEELQESVRRAAAACPVAVIELSE